MKTYSLGMKQRLGIAAALLKDPALLVLDEPANGLDPAGIVEVRELMRSLGAEGRTVFVSSHILSEVQQTCDRVAILARGPAASRRVPSTRCWHAGGRGAARPGRPISTRRSRCSTDAGIAGAPAGDALKVDACPPTRPNGSARTLAERGLYVSELRPDEVDLETVFLELTKDQGVAD